MHQAHILPLVPLMALVLTGCNQIWNAANLAEWVRVQAGDQGCDPATTELNEWVDATEDGNVWSGTCVNALSSASMSFGINVASVWTSSEAPADGTTDSRRVRLSPAALANAPNSGIEDAASRMRHRGCGIEDPPSWARRSGTAAPTMVLTSRSRLTGGAGSPPRR